MGKKKHKWGFNHCVFQLETAQWSSQSLRFDSEFQTPVRFECGQILPAEKVDWLWSHCCRNNSRPWSYCCIVPDLHNEFQMAVCFKCVSVLRTERVGWMWSIACFNHSLLVTVRCSYPRNFTVGTSVVISGTLHVHNCIFCSVTVTVAHCKQF